MILKAIEVENWLCYRGHHRVELPSGAVAVVGEHDGDPRRSNWAGKTALLEAVSFALWGWHRKRLAADVVTWGETVAWVDLDFDGYHVRRGRGPQGAVFEVTGLNVDMRGADAESFVSKVFRLSRDDAFASCVVRQGDLTRFVDATSGERQAIVADWLDQSVWERCEARVREDARQADARAGVLAQQVVRLREQLDAPRAGVAELEENLKLAQGEADAARALAGKALAVGEFLRAKERAAALKKLLGAGAQKPPSMAEVADLDQFRGRLVEELRAARQARDWDGSCPVAEGLECPARSAVLGRVSVLKNRDAQCKKLMTELARVDEEVRELEQRKVAAAQQEAARAEWRKELERLVARGRELRAEFSDVDDEDLTGAPNRVRAAEQLLQTCVERLAVARAKEDQILLWEAELASLTAERDEMTARADALWGAADAFGRNGVQAAEAAGALADLESRANRILEGTGLDVALASAREGQKLESACRRCRHTYRGQKDKSCPRCGTKRERSRTDVLDVLVSASGGPRQDVAECSGGARALVGAAFRLGAASLLKQTRGSPYSTLLVDEPFASLDEEHRHLLARRLAEMARIAGYEQMLVVTHDRDLADALPHRLAVRHSAGASTVELEA